jgi:hypothetical protein
VAYKPQFVVADLAQPVSYLRCGHSYQLVRSEFRTRPICLGDICPRRRPRPATSAERRRRARRASARDQSLGRLWVAEGAVVGPRRAPRARVRSRDRRRWPVRRGRGGRASAMVNRDDRTCRPTRATYENRTSTPSASRPHAFSRPTTPRPGSTRGSESCLANPLSWVLLELVGMIRFLPRTCLGRRSGPYSAPSGYTIGHSFNPARRAVVGMRTESMSISPFMSPRRMCAPVAENKRKR